MDVYHSVKELITTTLMGQSQPKGYKKFLGELGISQGSKTDPQKVGTFVLTMNERGARGSPWGML